MGLGWGWMEVDTLFSLSLEWTGGGGSLLRLPCGLREIFINPLALCHQPTKGRNYANHAFDPIPSVRPSVPNQRLVVFMIRQLFTWRDVFMEFLADLEQHMDSKSSTLSLLERIVKISPQRRTDELHCKVRTLWARNTLFVL